MWLESEFEKLGIDLSVLFAYVQVVCVNMTIFYYEMVQVFWDGGSTTDDNSKYKRGWDMTRK